MSIVSPVVVDAFWECRRKEPYPYLILDERYEKVREARVITRQAVMIEIGVA